MVRIEKECLNELSKEQLIYLIEQMERSLCIIGEVCVSESKMHIDSDKAVNKIRENIYHIPSLYDPVEVAAYINMKLENISVDEYRKAIGLD